MATTASRPIRAKVRPRRSKAPSPATRMVLTGISWDTYECILKDHEDRSAPRFTYDQGTLEIMSPTIPHEKDHLILAELVGIVTEELEIEALNVGSATFRRQNIEGGFEADSTFYVQHEAAMRNKEEFDPLVDPPPDFVIESDATHSSIPKLPLFARFGVPEVWRVEQRSVVLYHLAGDHYVEAEASQALPLLTKEALNHFLDLRRGERRTVWVKEVRSWAREQATRA